MIDTLPSRKSPTSSAAWDGQHYQLWSSKSLNLLWLEDSASWCSPQLFPLTYASRFPAGADAKPTPPAWYWLVTPQFAAWVLRLTRKASLQGLALSRAESAGWAVIQAAMRELDLWSQVESLAVDRVILPGHELLTLAADLAYFGELPMFDGIEKIRTAL
jgi:hypothetical protein